MTQYMVAIHHPDDFDPSTETEATRNDIIALNKEMVAAGVRVFVGGLEPARSAVSVRARPGGQLLVTDGPYMETKEHIAGLLILEAANLDAALAWARRGTVTSAPVEVREILFFPAPDEGADESK